MGANVDSLWVFGYDKETGNRMEITLCKRNNAPFYAELYRSYGYRVEVMTDEEVDKMQEDNDKR